MNDELIKHAYILAEVIKQQLNVDYNLEGIRAIERQINNERDFYENQTEEDKTHYSYTIGSFIAVCMIKNYNGTWEESENGLGIRINNNLVFPIQKTYKFLSQNGIFDSISSFYEISASFDKILENRELNLESGKFRIVKATEISRNRKWWKFWRRE